MGTINFFSADSSKHKARVHQLDFIGAFLQANVKNIVFVKFTVDMENNFPEYCNYFGRLLRMKILMYVMTN